MTQAPRDCSHPCYLVTRLLGCIRVVIRMYSIRCSATEDWREACVPGGMSEPCKQWRKPSGDVVMFSLFLLDHELDPTYPIIQQKRQ
jgi:hypothetical protein